MAVPNASQIRFLESKLNSKRELRLLQTDFQGRAGINWGPVQDFKVRPNRIAKYNSSRSFVVFELVSHNGMIGNRRASNAAEQASRLSAFW